MSVDDIVYDIYKNKKWLIDSISNMSAVKMEQDEIIHILTCAILLNPYIYENFEKNKNKYRFIAISKYKKMVFNEQPMIAGIGQKLRLEKIKTRLSIEAEYNNIDNINIEEDIVNNIDDMIYLSKIKNILGDNKYEFLKTYYEVGGVKCGEIYGISRNACKCKAYKMIKKIKRHLNA